MNIICKPRGCGKTYDLIMESARTGNPIITENSLKAMYINNEAKRIGVNIKQAISAREYMIFKNNKSLFDNLSWTGKVLIDNVDLVLNNLFEAEVVTVTCTPGNTKENDKMDSIANEIRTTRKRYCDRYANEIVDVNIIVPDKVVEVTFFDGIKERAVCKEPDVFSLEQAIGICISKKVMGGSSTYNNAVKRGIKVYENKISEEQMNKEEQERIERKRAKKKLTKSVGLLRKRRRKEKSRLRSRRKLILEP